MDETTGPEPRVSRESDAGSSTPPTQAVVPRLSITYREPVPSSTNEEEYKKFKEFVFGSSDPWVPTDPLRQHDYVALPDVAHQTQEDTSASYGHDGTTASVDSHGLLTQISRYLGAGRSGFFTLDTKATPPPYQVQERAKRLIDPSENDDSIGAIFEDSSPQLNDMFNDAWKLDFTHDRWPRYTHQLDDGLSVTCQHYVSNGIVFVRTRFHVNKVLETNAPLFSGLKLRPDEYHIRELDFLNTSSTFNISSQQQSHEPGPNQCSVILINNGFEPGDPSEAGDEYLNAVCLIFAISVNGKVRELEKSQDWYGDCYRVKSSGEDNFTVTPAHPVEIVEAYRLQLVPREADWKDCVISQADFLGIHDAFTTNLFRKLPFSRDSHLDFILRRNLEHILSVCSIPVPVTRPQSEGEKVDPPPAEIAEHGQGTRNKNYDVALTCGDLSGHRIVTSASYFAFKFLLAMLTYLRAGDFEKEHFQPCQCNSAERLACGFEMRRRLSTRIEDTCRAHVAWIGQATFADGRFKTHYWASGQEMSSDDGVNARDTTLMPDASISTSTDMPFQILTDTPFQILKLSDFAAIFDDDDKALVRSYLLHCVRPWIRHLDQKNKRGFFAFSRTTDTPREGYHNYRLEDHVWIWSALQVVDQLGLGRELKKERKQKKESKKSERKQSRSQVDSMSLEQESSQQDILKWGYSPAEFRRNVLRRFTVQNRAARQRMLAVARCWSESRFLLRTRDTAFFHDTKPAFFDRTDDLWKATINAQKYHEENQDATWDSPLRYALALLMASKGLQINGRSPQDMLKTAKKVLFQSSSASGMLPGQLNMETKDPEIFQVKSRRDFYWHTCFETPYILWKVRSTLECEAISTQTVADDSGEPHAVMPQLAKGSPSHHLHLEMKKSMPHNDLIDQQSIVEISDEWLYNPPPFLDFKPNMTGIRDFFQYFANDGIFESLLELFYDLEPRSLLRRGTFSFMDAKGHNLEGAIIDVPKSKHMAGDPNVAIAGNPLDKIELLTSHGMYGRLDKLRTAEEAKKRLIWSFKANPDLGLLCAMASPGAEAAFIASFFDRHFHREKYFTDDTTAALNAWTTEFHLSSYQLVDENDGITDLKFLGGQKWIRRAGTGFRIVGDFFDRFWTCHVLEYEPKDYVGDAQVKAHHPDKLQQCFDTLIKNRIPEMERGRNPWRQRKVLELILFDRMLEKIIGRYKELLQHVDGELRDLLSDEEENGDSSPVVHSDVLSISNAIFSQEMDSYAYLEFRKKWPPFQYTLQIMEEDLKETLDTVGLWKTRERDREPERPRWTINDEAKYRSVITKMTTANNHKIRDLERYHSKIQSLRESLASRLGSTRDDLSFQSAENVRYFTYITVVFLPLGFGAATMSTSGLPSRKMVLDMFVAAVIIFIPTLLALAYGPTVFDEILRPMFRAIRDYKHKHWPPWKTSDLPPKKQAGKKGGGQLHSPPGSSSSGGENPNKINSSSSLSPPPPPPPPPSKAAGGKTGTVLQLNASLPDTNNTMTAAAAATAESGAGPPPRRWNLFARDIKEMISKKRREGHHHKKSGDAQSELEAGNLLDGRPGKLS
ncbi:hypothetical protein AYL99_09913 [Fonsecaea erecta]|uniref:Uncharacterized protein n=1 Tax=Fonsecaea erecta TaxID=1367422 RepID=A0A178Z8D9_9EURO|nr:hypothetical protein AYL99_09913 [Fonsecaea erecta]OAP55761.1 hypothetical protein AYL99_09913 [Fonsecaea erecta]